MYETAKLFFDFFKAYEGRNAANHNLVLNELLHYGFLEWHKARFTLVHILVLLLAELAS